MIKIENQIYADLISLVNSALDNFNIEGWKVCKLIQPVKLTEIKPTVYVAIDQTSKRGTQFSRNRKENNQFIHEEVFKEEVIVKIYAFRRSLVNDSSLTLNANDVLKMIASWLVSPYGIAEIRARGYSIYNPSQIRLPSLKNDSQNVVPLPSFDITFIVEQSWDTSGEVISGYKLNMKGI